MLKTLAALVAAAAAFVAAAVLLAHGVSVGAIAVGGVGVPPPPTPGHLAAGDPAALRAAAILAGYVVLGACAATALLQAVDGALEALAADYAPAARLRATLRRPRTRRIGAIVGATWTALTSGPTLARARVATPMAPPTAAVAGRRGAVDRATAHGRAPRRPMPVTTDAGGRAVADRRATVGARVPYAPTAPRRAARGLPRTYLLYTVQPGDWISTVAQRFDGPRPGEDPAASAARLGRAVEAIYDASRGRPQPDNLPIEDPNLIRPGQILRIPLPLSNVTVEGDRLVYIVQPGDYLSRIAASLCGDWSRYDEIKAANPGAIGADNVIVAGQRLFIPTSIAVAQPDGSMDARSSVHVTRARAVATPRRGVHPRPRPVADVRAVRRARIAAASQSRTPRRERARARRRVARPHRAAARGIGPVAPWAARRHASIATPTHEPTPAPTHEPAATIASTPTTAPTATITPTRAAPTPTATPTNISGASGAPTRAAVAPAGPTAAGTSSVTAIGPVGPAGEPHLRGSSGGDHPTRPHEGPTITLPPHGGEIDAALALGLLGLLAVGARRFGVLSAPRLPRRAPAAVREAIETAHQGMDGPLAAGLRARLHGDEGNPVTYVAAALGRAAARVGVAPPPIRWVLQGRRRQVLALGAGDVDAATLEALAVAIGEELGADVPEWRAANDADGVRLTMMSVKHGPVTRGMPGAAPGPGDHPAPFLVAIGKAGNDVLHVNLAATQPLLVSATAAEHLVGAILARVAVQAVPAQVRILAACESPEIRHLLEALPHARLQDDADAACVVDVDNLASVERIVRQAAGVLTRRLAEASPGRRLPVYLVVIDRADAVFANATLWRSVDMLAQMGPAAGIHVIVSTSAPLRLGGRSGAWRLIMTQRLTPAESMALLADDSATRVSSDKAMLLRGVGDDREIDPLELTISQMRESFAVAAGVVPGGDSPTDGDDPTGGDAVARPDGVDAPVGGSDGDRPAPPVGEGDLVGEVERAVPDASTAPASDNAPREEDPEQATMAEALAHVRAMGVAPSPDDEGDSAPGAQPEPMVDLKDHETPVLIARGRAQAAVPRAAIVPDATTPAAPPMEQQADQAGPGRPAAIVEGETRVVEAGATAEQSPVLPYRPHGAPARGAPTASLRVMGVPALTIAGETEGVRLGPTPRRYLCILALERGPIPADQVAERLFSSSDVADPRGEFRRARNTLRRALREHAPALANQELIIERPTGKPTQYELNRDLVTVDLDRFAAARDDVQSIPPGDHARARERMNAMVRAFNAYTDDIGRGVATGYLERQQQDVRGMYFVIANELIDVAEAAGDYKHIERVARTLLRYDVLNDYYHSLVIQALGEQGRQPERAEWFRIVTNRYQGEGLDVPERLVKINARYTPQTGGRRGNTAT